MSVIEVQRTDDDAEQTFDASEIGSGSVVSFVTQNVANADGLIQFRNQSAPTGNTSAPDESQAKIVEGGSLVTDGQGNPTVKWDGLDDGYELDFSTTNDVSSSVSQTVSLKVDPDDLKGKPQTFVESDGLRVWNQDDEIVATITSSSEGWRRWSDTGRTFPSSTSNMPNCISYKGDLWVKSWNGNDYDMIFWDGSSWTISNPSLSDSLDSLGVYDGDLYVTDKNQGDVHKFDGSTWTNPHTASSGSYNSFVTYNGNAYMANGNNSSVTEYDGNTWDESFLTTSDLSVLESGDFPWGLCVFEGTLYLALDDAGPAHIVQYDPTNGWQDFAAVDTSTQGNAGNTFNGFMALGSYDGTLVAGTQSGQFWTYDKQADTWNFQGLACSYLSSFHVWNGDLYMAGRFGFYESDGVWKWDGSTLEKDLDDSEIPSGGFDGPFRFANVWEGKLFTYHRYVSDNLYVKGEGQEVRVPFDQSANEIEIDAAVSQDTLWLSVDGTTTSKTYDFSYDQDGVIRLGVDRGSVTGGETSNMDEPYTGTVKSFEHIPKVKSFFLESEADSFIVDHDETVTLTDETVTTDRAIIYGDLEINGEVKFEVSDSFLVGPSGFIDGVGRGFQPNSGDFSNGNGPGAGLGQSNDGGTGAGYGGFGGTAPDAFGAGGSPYGSETSVDIQKGSSGGNADSGSQGGGGGAALHVQPVGSSEKTSVRVDGIIDVAGDNGDMKTGGVRASGGGSGGGVLIEAPVSGEGVIIATGGPGGKPDNDSGGGGGGGRVKADRIDSSITVKVEGGAAIGQANPGTSGTVHEFEASNTPTSPPNVSTSLSSNEVTIGWDSVASASHYNVYRSRVFGYGFQKLNQSNVTSTSFTDSDINPKSNYYYAVTAVDSNESAVSDIAPGVNLSIDSGKQAYVAGEGFVLEDMKIRGRLFINRKFQAETQGTSGVSGTIDGFSLGFRPDFRTLFGDGNGPGGGTGQDGDGGNGAAYGGSGGLGGDRSTPSSPYGSPTSLDIQAGSAGGSAGYGQDGMSIGGSGGAAIDISGPGPFLLDGTMNFSGARGADKQGDESGQASGGGSGGGVLLQMPVQGSGSIIAEGGDGGGTDNDGGGGGSGGRIKHFGIGQNITTSVAGGNPPDPSTSGETGGDDGTIMNVS